MVSGGEGCVGDDGMAAVLLCVMGNLMSSKNRKLGEVYQPTLISSCFNESVSCKRCHTSVAIFVISLSKQVAINSLIKYDAVQVFVVFTCQGKIEMSTFVNDSTIC